MDEQFKREVVERLARLEESVNNHIPGAIKRVEASVKAIDLKVWGILIALSGALLSIWLK